LAMLSWGERTLGTGITKIPPTGQYMQAEHGWGAASWGWQEAPLQAFIHAQIIEKICWRMNRHSASD